MSKRNNSGYIGGDFRNEIAGVIDREKQNQIRNTYYSDQYSSETNLMGGPPTPDDSTFDYIINSDGGGSGSIATASLASGSVVGLYVLSGGGGATPSSSFTFTGGGGTGAAGYITGFGGGNSIALVELLHSIQSVYIANGGTGYSSPPTLTFSAPTNASGPAGNGVYATASCTISNGSIVSVTMTNTGSNYRGGANYPTITISGGGSPTVAASLVPILQCGRGYTSPPTVSVVGPGHSGSVISASIFSNIGSITLPNSGSGYTTVPSVKIDGAYFGNRVTSASFASASLSGNQVSGFTLTSGSSKYSLPPSITVGGYPTLPTVVDGDNKIVGLSDEECCCNSLSRSAPWANNKRPLLILSLIYFATFTECVWIIPLSFLCSSIILLIALTKFGNVASILFADILPTGEKIVGLFWGLNGEGSLTDITSLASKPKVSI